MKAIFLIIALAGYYVCISQTTISIPCDKDNTLYSESGTTSNATGVNLFAGVTAGRNRRRSLIHFALDQVPAGSTITAATLTLTCNNVAPQSGNAGINVFRLSSDWGEGTSANNPQGMGSPASANDATWTHRFFNTSTWTNPGGDFAELASGSAAVPSTGSVNISSQGLISDVQGWLNNPANNFGWMIAGNLESTAGNARRFASRNNADVNIRPTLSITYTGPLPVSLSSFTATLQTSNTLLKWVTASEYNNSHFVIEQSFDGRSFKPIGKVNGAINSALSKSYTFLHSNTAKGNNFYRLAQVDVDGTIRYSSIVTIFISTASGIIIKPNPVRTQLNLGASASLANKRYNIRNASGKVVQNGNVQGQTIPVSQLASGVYYLTIEGDAGKYAPTSFIKQ